MFTHFQCYFVTQQLAYSGSAIPTAFSGSLISTVLLCHPVTDILCSTHFHSVTVSLSLWHTVVRHSNSVTLNCHPVTDIQWFAHSQSVKYFVTQSLTYGSSLILTVLNTLSPSH